MNMANGLTVSRILLIPIFLYIFFVPFKNHLLIAGIIFFLSGLTDLLDGYIARTYNQVSDLGRLLDPLADKLTMITIFFALFIKQLIPIWILLVVISREVIILGGAVLVYLNHVDIINPSKIGKYATLFLYVTAFAYIINLDLLKNFVFIAIPLTVISGVNYCITAYQALNNG
ncbi:MAG: CDP-diacylglycerol--glycerol-3-phosphate 3-phosphatidyltransferase [Bacillota bacterium]